MVPTAKEFLKKHNLDENDMILSDTIDRVEQCMLDFVEAHRQECLKQASEKARKSFVPTGHRANDGYYVVNKDSILNAYSRKNIR